jgi:DNA repair exonuclease SbcCD nuclease subunit
MTTFTLFTDPHLGTRRAAHTTRESSKRLTLALFKQAWDVIEGAEKSICLGDLFDRAFNDESILVQGYEIASNCMWTLAGNHDETNRADTVTSLRALREMGCSIISSPSLSEPYFDNFEPLYFVPHHASQELFEQAMREAAEHAARERAGRASVLMLHCNYDQPFATEDDTLNLSPAVANLMLESFDYIFIGHEHKPSTYFDGRVVILGNTHATSFADISDKFSYQLEITDDSIDLTKTRIWSKDERFASVMFGQELPDLSGVQFIDVIGAADEAVAVADFMQMVWENAPDALAVRNSVSVAGVNVVDDEAEKPVVEDLRTRISRELDGTDLADLFSELAKEVAV